MPKDEWKSKFWETDPETGLHDFVRREDLEQKLKDLYSGVYYSNVRVFTCTKCGFRIQMSLRPENLEPEPLPGWGPHCTEVRIKEVVDG